MTEEAEDRLVSALLHDLAHPGRARERRDRRVDAGLRAIDERLGRRARRRPVAAALAAAAAAAVVLALVFDATATDATAAAERLLEVAREDAARRYEVTIQRNAVRAPIGRFRLDLSGDDVMRMEGLDGRFEGLVLGRDGDVFYAVPPRQGAPALVTESRDGFERWLGGREMSLERLVVADIVSSLLDDYDLEASGGGDGARLVATRTSGPRTRPRTVDVTYRERDGVIVRLSLTFGRDLPPRAPRQVRFDLLGEEPRDRDWFSVDVNVPADRQRVGLRR
ncbi:MAG: hypothetical protein AAGI22_07940 [Planctomycetota bacterium]